MENVHRRAAQIIWHLSCLSYSDRLKFLNLPTLEFSRRRGRIIEVFKIVKGLYDPVVTENNFRVNGWDNSGIPCQLKGKVSKTALRENFFSIAPVNDWNSLPERVVTADSINVFNSGLDKHWEESEYIVDFLNAKGHNCEADWPTPTWPADQNQPVKNRVRC